MKLGIIGGTGALDLFESGPPATLKSPFGAPSAKPEPIRVEGREGWFLARHGRPHRIPPHMINYRANIFVLRKLGVQGVIGVNAVGGIADGMGAGDLVLPDQLIDYTWGRAHTFTDTGTAALQHVEFGQPFGGPLRQAVLAAAGSAGEKLHDGGVYGATQGPRLETDAEIRRLARDGCDLVGMTGMPEAGLAREAGLEYVSICVVANRAAGLEEMPVSIEEIHRVLAGSMQRVGAIIRKVFVEIGQ